MSARRETPAERNDKSFKIEEGELPVGEIDAYGTVTKYVDFTDLYGQKCSMQNSSISELPAMWMGVEGIGRMHLSQKMVKKLLPILERFVETGSIAEEG